MCVCASRQFCNFSGKMLERNNCEKANVLPVTGPLFTGHGNHTTVPFPSGSSARRQRSVAGDGEVWTSFRNVTGAEQLPMSRSSFATLSQLRPAGTRVPALRLHRAVSELRHLPRAERGVVRAATAYDSRCPGRARPASARRSRPRRRCSRRSTAASYAPQRPVSGGAQRSAEGVQLNFEQAEIRDVIKVILGDILGRSYTVDSDVQGQVTLSTARRCRRATLAVLETVLRANGATLVEPAPTPSASCPWTPRSARSQVIPLGGRPVQVRPGYGITIVPLRNISATSAAQFIQPLVASPEDIRIDPAATPSCSAARRSSDRTWSRPWPTSTSTGWPAMRSACSRCERGNVEAIIPELQAIFAPFDPTGAEPSLLRFLPLARMNAVLAIAGDPEQVREVGGWVTRLDRGQAAGSQFYVYNLKHAAAEDVAKLLNEAFSEGPAIQRRPEPRRRQRHAWVAHSRSARTARPVAPRRFRRSAAAAGADAETRPSPARSRSWRARPTTHC